MAEANENARFVNEAERVNVNPQTGRRRTMPWLTLFDRSSDSVLNPGFASKGLEAHYQRLSFGQTTSRMRFAFAYLAACGAAWIVYLAIRRTPSWWLLLLPEAASVLVFALLLAASFAGDLFRRWHKWLSLAGVLLKAALLLCSTAALGGDTELQHLPVFDFVGSVQLCLLVYTLLPLPLFVSLLFGLVYSCLYVLSVRLFPGVDQPLVLVAQVVLLLVVQLIGFQLHIMSQVRRRSTFLRLCEGARIKRQLAKEKEAKDEMIMSLMPESVAKTIMLSSEGEEAMPAVQKGSVKFRKFNVNKLDNVSVLFADIVGFTNMSSGKSAPHLVYLLNDLFGRFDDLCDRSGCEKIATLGDCYYCVAGCPLPKDDHAECCVEMGRGMVVAIDQFDKDHEEAVNMRVGVHTGTVLCGIVGTMRFKFDVWSNDVTLANEMESSGKPGKVHVSKDTYNFVQDLYEFEKGEEVPDIRELKVLIEYYDEKKKGYAIKHTQEKKVIETFFIIERKDKRPPITLDKINVVKFSDMQPTAPVQEQDDAAVEVQGGGGPEDDELVIVMNAEDDNSKTFSSPPVSALTLNFLKEEEEAAYRTYGVVAHADGGTPAVGGIGSDAALTNPRVSPLADGCVQLASLLALGAAVLLSSPAPGAIVALIVSLALVSLFLAPFVVNWLSASGGAADGVWRTAFAWWPRNCAGAVLLVAPAAASLVGLATCPDDWAPRLSLRNAFLASLCAFALFTFFCSWTKSLTAVVVGVAGVALAFASGGLCPELPPALAPNATASSVQFSGVEFTVGVVEMLLLVLFLNRVYDISFRQSFHCELQAAGEKQRINKEKEQVEWLLHNIIPYYIETEMTEKKTYSRNLKNVGVVFATISNFSEFYDEQFQGGTEMLRVLNEYFADIEGLLSDSRFKDVEKIKTVGACLMAASGLNMKTRRQNADPDWDHLYALMDFCIDVITQTDEFNDALFSFRFALKIGYNVGEVTAGVIGSTKLLYDIWGDTVNVSSRMYSTGEKMRIQVTEDVAKKLSSHYEFEHRGTTFVKGKGDLETYLLVKKKE